MGVGTEVAWTPQMLTDERVHQTLMNIQNELRLLMRTHEQNLQILSDITLFYGMYFRLLLDKRYLKEYDDKLQKIKNCLIPIKVSDNKKVVLYKQDIQTLFEDFLFSILYDFQNNMSYFYKGKIRTINLDDIEIIGGDENGEII